MKVLLTAFWLLAAAAVVHAQDTAFAPGAAGSARNAASITTAKDLYASARYDEALTVLNGLRPADAASPLERRTIEQYRAWCLIALGRLEEAETAIAAVVGTDPFYAPGEADASPRVRTTFGDVRQRLLPDIAASRYSAAKQAYDRKQHADAERQFREVLKLLDDPQMNGRLADLRVLAAGFVELAAAAAAPPPVTQPVEPAPKPAVVPPVPSPPRIYGSDDRDVVPPVIVRQNVPQLPASIAGMVRDRGIVELHIDEQGRVVFVALRMRVHPLYDTILLNAAKEWRYRPAMLNGTAVPYRKLLQVTIKR